MSYIERDSESFIGITVTLVMSLKCGVITGAHSF